MRKSKIFQRILLIILALSLIAGVMSGCVSKNEGQFSTTQETKTQTEGAKISEEPSKSTDDDVPDYLNPTGFPIVKEKITLKLMGSKSPLHGEWQDMEVFKRMEALTNISFEFDTPLAQGYTEKKNLALASGDYPDVFYGGAINVQDEETYGPQGVFLPLEDYIDKYGPHIRKKIPTRMVSRMKFHYHIGNKPTVWQEFSIRYSMQLSAAKPEEQILTL